MRIGSDTGGTFTDLVAEDGRILKVPSTPSDPGSAVRAGIAALVGPSDAPAGASGAAGSVAGRAAHLAHGTTVATNALLERRGARTALVANEGFADVIEIARQDRPSLYDGDVRRPEPLVERALRLEVGGRIGPDGVELEPVDPDGLPALPEGVEAVAVCLLHSDLEPSHERTVAEALTAAGFDVTSSHEISPEVREYERTSTTVLNAYLRPVCRTYLDGLADAADEVTAMTSAGGLVERAVAADQPARLLLSGPAGGVLAGTSVAAANGFSDAVTFDMGGTSTDVCLILDGAPAPAAEREVDGLAVRLPSLDVHTIGAGGGSIASLDAGGALVVGPRSAGAVPGPACYGHGGTEPTVTDADLVLGRIPSGRAFPGLGVLDRAAAVEALDAAGITAEGVVAVVDAAMEQALRRVTVERGVDPSTLALVAFGGAGPLHACALADALGIGTVLVPARAGVFSAVGILAAPRQADVVRSWPTPTDHAGLDETAEALAAEAVRELTGDTPASGTEPGSRQAGNGSGVEVSVAFDCRYAGQSHELTVASVDGFHAEHARRNGFARPDAPVEVVAVRATARMAAPVAVDDLPAPERAGAVGPAVIAEDDCTIWVPEGWRAEPGAAGALVLRPEADRADPDGVGRGTVDPDVEDAARLQVLIARLDGVAGEMSAVLRRAAFSPNIKERADCSSALFAASGELLAQAENIPVHLGAMPASVAAVVDAMSRQGAVPVAGEQWIVNDPFAGGTHLNDITVVAPCIVDGELLGWVANRAHHADVGGAAPGSIPADAVEIFQEGLRIPPVRASDEVLEVLLANSRTPGERRGDVDAQLGANVRGVERLAEVVAGLGGVAGAREAFDEVLDYGERRMRAALGRLADGTWSFEDVVDSTGSAPDQQVPAKVRLALTVQGDSVRFDFTGTDPQRRGNVHAVAAVTASSVAFALRSAVDPDLPANGGCLRPVEVVAPPGTIVSAQPPVAVGAGNVEVSQRVADVCLGALAQVEGTRVGAAGQGTMNNLLIGGQGTGPDQAWVYYETTAGGAGARPGSHGESGIHTAMTNTKNTPIEALERAFPLRVLRQRLRRGSGGAGSAPGGEGIERDLQVLVDATVSLITERRVSQPWGLAGGEPGSVGENWLLPGGDEARAERLPDKCTIQLEAGDVLRMLTPGGGGWGPTRSS